jgi:hypothetical protein
MKPKVIGLCGVARCGKDSFGSFLVSLNKEKFKKASFAYELKKDLDPFLKTKLNISAFTEDPVEKEIIRPMLICWGTDVIREKIDKNRWIEKIQQKVVENYEQGFITIIPDVRFLNEVEWVNSNGISIYIHQDGCEPKGYIEQETLSLKNKTTHYFEWKKMNEFDTEGLKRVRSFFNQIYNVRSMQ